MVYGSVRVAVLLYTLWPILAGPFVCPHFQSAELISILRHPESAVGHGGPLTLQPTRGQAVGVCVCLYRPRKATLGPACGSVPMYLSPAPSQLFEPARIVRRPRPRAYLLFKHRLPIRTFLPCENETKKQQK